MLERSSSQTTPSQTLAVIGSLAIPLALALGLLLVGVARVQPGEPSRASGASSTARQVRVDPVTIKIPVVDGTDIPFARLSTIDGLSQTKVSSIVQDDQGFLWLGTQYGLNRYDGYNFKVFVPDPTDSNSLSGVFITAVFKDREGTLWVGADQFLHRFEPTTETFKRYAVPFVTHISQDAAGMLWLSTGGGLYSLDPAQGAIRRYAHDPEDPASLSSNEVRSSGEDRKGRFWVSSAKGLDEFDRKAEAVTRRIPVGGPSHGFAFHEDRRGTFWIVDLYRRDLAVFDRETNTLTRYSLQEPEPPGPMLMGFSAILEDRNGTLWLGTHGAGLLKFDRDRQRFIRYRHDPDDPYSLAQNNVEELFADREGSMWAGLGSMGVTHFLTNSLPFERVRGDAPNPSGKVDRFVGALYADRQGILWVGTPRALNRIDRKAGNRTSYRPTADPTAGTDVIAIHEDRSGDLWVGTYSHGLLRFDQQTGRFKAYRHDPGDPNSLSSDIVPRLLVDRGGTLWAATANGLNRFDAATGRFTVYKLDPHKRAQSYLDLVEDADGALWLGTDASGLHRFDPATGRFTVYEHDVDRPGTLSDNRVNSVHFDRTGTMWLGTQNGLNSFEANTGTFTAYDRRHGLPGNAVGCVLEDGHGDLWMSTNNGVARFNPRTKSFKNYSTADGLPGPDLTGWGACSKSVAGELFFGGFSGATAFFPDRLTDTAEAAPPVVLTDLRLFGLPVALKGGSLLTKPINYTDAVTLSHDQKIFSIGFSALSYRNAATNRYRYLLERFDPQWNEVGSGERRASYTMLPAGTYTLHVQAATERGDWSEPGARLRIDILPPWWSTVWFRAIYVSLLLLAVSAAYYYRLRRMEAAMGARFDERLAERTRLARELHDTLMQTIQASKLVAEDALDHAADAGRMSRAMERVAQWLEQATQEGRVALNSLRTSTTQKNSLAEALRRATENNGQSSSMMVAMSVVGHAREMHPIVRDEVYRIGYEAIRNAYQHSKGSRLTVELRYSQDLTLRVADNGMGIEPAVADTGKDGHFGLQGMRERAARIEGTLTLVTTLGSGTEIKLVVPGRITSGSRVAAGQSDRTG